MTKQKFRNCDICEFKYEIGFFGTGTKYCSTVCAKEARRRKHVSKYVRKKRDCVICGRDIATVGLKSHANKYCSNRCMVVAQHMKLGTKYIEIRIPISDLKTLFSTPTSRI